MNHKHTSLLIIYTIASIGVLFWFTGAKADTAFYSNPSSTPNLICFDGDGQDADCDGVGTLDGTVAHFHQQVNIQGNYFGSDGFNLSGVSLYIHSQIDSGNAMSGYAVFYDQNDRSFATTTAKSVTGVGEEKFSLASPYTITDGMTITAVTVFLSWVNPGIDNRYYATYGSYPPNAGLPSNYDAYYCDDAHGTCASYDYFSLGDDWDWGMTFYADFTDLAFTEPENGTTVYEYTTTISGTCNAGLDIEVFNGTSYASSTSYYAYSNECTDSEFSDNLILTQGNWTATASSSGDHATTTFYKLDYEPEAPEILESYFDDLEGGEGSFWSFLYDWGTKLMTVRPYSYITDVWYTFNTAGQEATSTSPFPDLTFSLDNYNSSTPFVMDAVEITNLYDVYEESDWQDIRTTFNLVLYVAIVFYFWYRIKRLI